ncbi:MAG: hypothetical protein ACOX5G_10650 [Kiritimatiellia bacterium]
MPARLYGYAYQDADLSLTRNAGDGVCSGMVVQVWLHGMLVASTNAADDGYYEFQRARTGNLPGALYLRHHGPDRHRLRKVPPPPGTRNATAPWRPEPATAP